MLISSDMENVSRATNTYGGQRLDQTTGPRVLFVIDTLDVGGAEQSILHMATCFRGVKPMVCHVYKAGALLPAYERAGLLVVGLGVHSRYGVLTGALRLLKLIRRERPAVVHVTLFRAGIVARVACVIAGVTLVDSFVNDPYSAQRQMRLSATGAIKLTLVKLIDRLTAGAARHFVAISETVAKSNAEALGIPRSAITVIYRGREPERLESPPAKVLRNLRAELELPEGTPVILNVARLLLRKGQLELLRAFRLVRQQLPNARLVIAGEGPDRLQVERELERLELAGRVHLLGSRGDVPALLHLADVFAFPSHYEGHGGALVEAMLAGRPIVATDIPVHRESIEGGRSGLLVPLGDETALANAISTLLTDRDQGSRLGSAARADALERFTVSRAAKLHEELYLRLLGERAHATHSA